MVNHVLFVFRRVKFVNGQVEVDELLVAEGAGTAIVEDGEDSSTKRREFP